MTMERREKQREREKKKKETALLKYYPIGSDSFFVARFFQVGRNQFLPITHYMNTKEKKKINK